MRSIIILTLFLIPLFGFGSFPIKKGELINIEKNNLISIDVNTLYKTDSPQQHYPVYLGIHLVQIFEIMP